MQQEFPDCTHRPPCPGCPRYGEPAVDPEAKRRLVELAAELGGPRPEFYFGTPLGYRHRARLAVRGRATSPKIGIFQQGSHRIADIPRCPIHHPLINGVVAGVKRAIVATRTAPYHEGAHAGMLRYLQVVVERATQKAQVVVVANTRDAGEVAPLTERIIVELGARLHSLFVNLNAERTNTILGNEMVHVWGPPAVRETIGGAEVFFPPDAFGQSNLGLFDAISDAISGWVPTGASLAEFYAGTGAIGLGLLERTERVVFNELGAGSLAGLRLGLDALPAPLRAKAEVRAGPATSHLDVLEGADCVIVDPPRKGVDPDLLRALVARRTSRFIYLSCGIESFFGDARTVVASGAYRMTQIQAYALLPFTEHVETLALFDAFEPA